MQFNERLKDLRTKKGVSQAELAKKIFVSRSAVAKWENGLGLPNEASLNLLTEYFSISKEELFADKQTETIIVGKNITISKSRKIIFAVCSVGLAIIIALTFALIFMPKTEKAQRFSIDGSDYRYTYQLPEFNRKLAETLNVTAENIFINNGGEIHTDQNGKIVSVNIDTFIIDNDNVYSVQSQKNCENDYVVIKEFIKDIGGERVKTEKLFNAISLWKFDNCNYGTIFIISTDMVVNPLRSEFYYQYLYAENDLAAVNENQIELYSRIMVLADNRQIGELYLKIKG